MRIQLSDFDIDQWRSRVQKPVPVKSLFDDDDDDDDDDEDIFSKLAKLSSKAVKVSAFARVCMVIFPRFNK